MTRPWFSFHSRDWLDNKELRRCSPLSRSILVDLMCLAHEGIPYGYLADKVGPLTIGFLAARCVVSNRQLLNAIDELKTHGRVSISEQGHLYIERMVTDERIRLARANGGKLSEGHPNTHRSKAKQGYPSTDPSTHPSVENDSRGRARADSDSGIKPLQNTSPVLEFSEYPLTAAEVRGRFPSADLILVNRIVDACARQFISVDNPKIPTPTDATYAAAVKSASSESGTRQTSAALYLKSVPAVIESWAKYGKTNGNKPESLLERTKRYAAEQEEKRNAKLPG